MLTTRWWWVRHAPVINPAGVIYGQRDVPADCTGIGACRRPAHILPADAVWLHTHLRRTRQTAEAILATRNHDGGSSTTLLAEPALAEQNFGIWQGLSHDEVQARMPEQARLFWLSPAMARPPGGESFADVVTRVSQAVLRLSRDHAGRDIVAVAHGGTIRAALTLALALDPEMALNICVDTLSLTRLDCLHLPDRAPAWRIVAVNLPMENTPVDP